MLRLYRASLFSVIVILWLLTPTSIPAQQTESLAILDLEGRGISAIEAASLTDRLRSELVKTGEGKLVVLVLLAATGYYGYTQGWFDEWIKPPDDGLRIGNPPSVPSP